MVVVGYGCSVERGGEEGDGDEARREAGEGMHGVSVAWWAECQGGVRVVN